MRARFNNVSGIQPDDTAGCRLLLPGRPSADSSAGNSSWDQSVPLSRTTLMFSALMITCQPSSVIRNPCPARSIIRLFVYRRRTQTRSTVSGTTSIPIGIFRSTTHTNFGLMRQAGIAGRKTRRCTACSRWVRGCWSYRVMLRPTWLDRIR